MLQDFKYKLISDTTNKVIYEITIIDSDFVEVVSCQMTGYAGNHHDGEGSKNHTLHVIANIYSKRNLNVAQNIFAMMLITENKWKHWTIEDQIKFHLRNETPLFKRYYPELKKYLVFM